jgi:hypothetical protein
MGVKNLGSLPPDGTVLLYCSPSKFEKSGADYIAPSTDAFRYDDDGISVTWIEYFKPPPPNIDQAKQAIAKSLTVKPAGVYAKATVACILSLAAKANLNVSVVHDPIEKNHGHSLIKGWPLDDAIRLILTRAFPPPAERVGV